MNTRRMLSLFLCLVMVLSLVPTTAFAAGNPVSSIAVTGAQTPTYGAACSTSSIVITTEPAAVISSSTIRWMKLVKPHETLNQYIYGVPFRNMTEGETFEAGTYRLLVEVFLRTGYTFNEGCAVTVNGNAVTPFPSEFPDYLSFSVVFTVEKPAPTTCTVTFDLNGKGEPFSDTYTIGETPGLPVGPFNAVGFTFDGWYLDPSCTVPYSAVALTGDLTLYARWIPDTIVKPIVLSFDEDWITWDAVPGADMYLVYFYKSINGKESLDRISQYSDTAAYFKPILINHGAGDYKVEVLAMTGNGYHLGERAASEWKTFTAEQSEVIASDSGWFLDRTGNLVIHGQINNTSVAMDTTPWENYKEQIKTVTTMPGASCNSYAYLFADCPNLISADLGNLKSNSNLNSMRDLFSGCENLKTVNLRGLNTASVTEMQYMFYNCKSLAYLDVSGLDTFSAKDMSYMFAFCSSLTSLDVSGFYAPDVVDTVGMFAGCTGIRELNLGILDARCLDSMLGMFMGCSNLQKLTFFAYSQAPNAVLAFYGCNNLMSLHTNDVLLQEVADQIIGISGNWLNKVNGWHYDTVSQLSSIAEGEAYLERTNCVVLPAETVLIGDSAFAGIKASEVVIPVGCQTIGDYAFSSCSSLRYIHIPASVTSISSNAFAGVSNLTVYAPASSYAASYATAHGFRFVKK